MDTWLSKPLCGVIMANIKVALKELSKNMGKKIEQQFMTISVGL